MYGGEEDGFTIFKLLGYGEFGAPAALTVGTQIIATS
jgi:hypothetical protein